MAKTNLSHSEQPGPPCTHMEGMLNRAADGTAGPFSRWYAFAHAARCGRCGRYLRALQEMISRLKRGKDAPSEEVLARLSEKLPTVES